MGSDLARRLGLLVLGDGAATHTLRAPGYFDRKAEGPDAVVAGAPAAADFSALLALDAGLASEMLVAVSPEGPE